MSLICLGNLSKRRSRSASCTCQLPEWHSLQATTACNVVATPVIYSRWSTNEIWYWQGGSQSTGTKTHPCSILSTNLTWLGLGSNLPKWNTDHDRPQPWTQPTALRETLRIFWYVESIRTAFGQSWLAGRGGDGHACRTWHIFPKLIVFLNTITEIFVLLWWVNGINLYMFLFYYNFKLVWKERSWAGIAQSV